VKLAEKLQFFTKKKIKKKLQTPSSKSLVQEPKIISHHDASISTAVAFHFSENLNQLQEKDTAD